MLWVLGDHAGITLYVGAAGGDTGGALAGSSRDGLAG